MRLSRWLIAPAAVALVALAAPDARPQKKDDKKPSPKSDAAELLKPQPRPKRPDLSPSAAPLQFVKGERVAFVGNSTAERMNLFGHFETILHLRHPDKELVVRNFARPADEVGLRQRPSDYTKLDDPLAAFGADTYLCFFGFNESFAGEAGVAKFTADYEKYLDDTAAKYPRDDAGSTPRFVIVSPIAVEQSGDRLLPDATKQSADVKRYADAAKAVAAKRGLLFVDLLKPTDAMFGREPGLQFTVNGVHVNQAGDKAVAEFLAAALFLPSSGPLASGDKFEALRQAVVDKSWVHLQDYRMLNGWYVYGGRRTWDTETFPREYLKIRNMAAVRDRRVWDMAQGKDVPATPDDSGTGDLFTPQTRFGEPRQAYSENPQGGPRIQPPDDLIKSCTVPPGFEIKLFADEKQFPELAKPCQMAFDGKGRLWVSTMPSYPLWKPGDPKPADKLIILEDTDGDGRADKCTTFYDKLHCPTGFEFFNGGVLVVDQPRLIWLKDTDGDDKADVVQHVLDGWATEDTHHTINAFEMSPAGRLQMLEGVSMSTAVETPWGPFRNFASSGCYTLDPRTWQLSHYNTPGYGNPWCFVYNEWGQGFCGDGTGANQHWDTPLSGAQFRGRKGLNPLFDTEKMRPVVGSEFLVSRQFPDDVQGQFIYACVINMNGIPRWSIADDGAGYKGTRVRHDPKDAKTAYDLIKSTDKHFRPVDPQIGPDGALWFGDWANPLIGHMQYSQRDPNRDHAAGRIYRLVYKDKPLLKPVLQHGRSVAELCEQFREYEWRTRYRVRAELRGRMADAVLPDVAAWAAKLSPSDPAYDRLRCEALWLQQSFHQVDESLLRSLLATKTPEARAAAVRVVADERDRIADSLPLLKAAASDSSLRARVEAVRGLSFYPTLEAAEAVATSLDGPGGKDYWVKYTAEAALGANEPAWRQAFITGQFAKGNDPLRKLLGDILAVSKVGAQAVPHLQLLLEPGATPAEVKNKAMQSLADLKGGNANNGKEVFRRNCTACHRVGPSEGADYGPELTKVAEKHTRYKLVESIIDPNAEVDAKYLSTRLDLTNGKSVTGLVVSETATEIVIFDAKDKRTVKKSEIDERTQLKQSSMPEGLAGTMSPAEFLDVIEYLSKLK